MTDKEKLDAIRAEIHRLVDVRGYDREMANDLFAFMDSLPNEPKDKCQGCNNVKGCITCVDGSEWAHIEECVSIDFEQELYKAFGHVKDFTLGMQIAKRFYDMGKNSQELVSNDFEEALAQEWKGYNDRGAATVDALEDNTQELAFAKGFYKGWHYRKEEPISEELEESATYFARKDSEGISNPANFYYTVADKARIFKAGANWQKKHTINKAYDFFEEYLTEEECKFGISEWVEVKSNFDSIDSFIKAFKKYVEK